MLNLKNKIQNRIYNYALANYKEINTEDMILGKGLFNARCYQNSVQSAIEDPKLTVYMCLCFDRKQPFLHFINKNTEDNKFIDNTLGWEYKFYNYRIIREITQEEYNIIWDVFDNTRKYIHKINTNWFERIFTDSTII